MAGAPSPGRGRAPARCAQVRGAYAHRGPLRRAPRARSSSPRTTRPLVLGLGEGEMLLRQRHPGAPRAHARRHLPRRRRRRDAHAGKARDHDARGQPRRARAAAHRPGRRPRPRRAATSTSCSRRSTSSRAPSRTRLRGRVDCSRRATPISEGYRGRSARSCGACYFVACGTSVHAGDGRALLIEQLARIPCVVDIGSEVRYREPVFGPRIWSSP